ncbi:winged helix-turn-helix domain-containing protein [Candidatus Nitrosocosmicus franklandus]|uniref:winged helix-turn-helix domain-containing protein n=1 Tax=Candidatus Nitrosocosmicus franklandianus TaxID=1798806 RepID=UPI00155880B7|nr:winged helix-turn-helix domain-containing protein [Candidatus Nitrosocosmicus franklandus]
MVEGRDRGKTKYRDKCQIFYLIVKSCIGKSQTKNRLSYYSSYRRLNYYLADLVRLGLLRFDETQHRFLATPKGNEFVRKYDNIIEFVPSLKSDYEI